MRALLVVPATATRTSARCGFCTPLRPTLCFPSQASTPSVPSMKTSYERFYFIGPIGARAKLTTPPLDGESRTVHAAVGVRPELHVQIFMRSASAQWLGADRERVRSQKNRCS